MDVKEKVVRVLYVILFGFLAIVLRVWNLGIVERDARVIEALKPRHRTVLVKADRGTIVDRFGIPLATNKISYNAAIYYSQIGEIPAISWKEEGGKRVRVYERKEYIRKLAGILAENLGLESDRTEDLIHSKASLFPHAPFVIKANLSEEEYYRLKALQRDFPGIQAEIASTRVYPLGKTASHLIGTMGAINSKEYATVASELKSLGEATLLYEQGLESALPEGYRSFEEVYTRLNELKEKAYSLTDLVGKSGLEARFEEELRGFFGKKILEVDQKGRFVRELAGGRGAIGGNEIQLSISAELQQFAEELLKENEKIREGRSIGFDPGDRKRKVQKQPLVKGGAIVALDPKTGEIVAFASHPGFDPNDFIPSNHPDLFHAKQKKVNRWLESERFIQAVWNGEETLYRERVSEENLPLSWDLYLDLLLGKEDPIRSFFQKIDDVKGAIGVQEDFEALLYFSGKQAPFLIESLFSLKGKEIVEALRANKEAAPHLRRLEPLLKLIPNPQDQLFAIDLCRVAVDSTRFPDSLIKEVGALKLSAYWSLAQAFHRVEKEIRLSTQEAWRKTVFKAWREEHQKEFLLEKRREEKERKTYARPYLDYLDQKEKELFAEFWREKRLSLLQEVLEKEGSPLALKTTAKTLSSENLLDFLHSFRTFDQLERPLLGNYPRLKVKGREAVEKDLAKAFYPQDGMGYLRSFAFQAAGPLGSIFKLVTSYEALRQGINFSIVDRLGTDAKGEIVSYTPTGTPYPRIYKGGRLPKSSAKQIGKIDLIGALEQSSNPFFSIIAGDFLEKPDDLAKTAHTFGFGERTGIGIPGETRGHLPTDLSSNKTGLYSFAIGQHTLLSTPLQAALFIASIANGGELLKPRITLQAKGKSPERDPFSPENTFASDALETLGIHFPLFTKAKHTSASLKVKEENPAPPKTILLPPSIRNKLLEGMHYAVWGEKGNARASIIRTLALKPEAKKAYLSLKGQMVGKTSTAEILHNPNVNPSSKAQMYKHIWFGAISFEPGTVKGVWDKPDLVVVVLLRYGDSGKEAAPLAALTIQKWREIREASLRK